MTEPRASRRTWILTAALVLLLGAVLTAVAVARPWDRSPDRAFEGGYGVANDSWVVGRTMWVTIDHVRAPGREITIDSITPRFEANRAEVEYVVCDVDAAVAAGTGLDGPGSGGRDNDVDRNCSRLTPAEGATLDLGGDPGSELLVGVTPTGPGRTVVRSHRIEFSEDGRTGTADATVEVDIVAH